MLQDPVFVLCNGRSGSTLLRFLLDAHPDFACPPEAGMPQLCAQLAGTWSLLDGSSAHGIEEGPLATTAHSEETLQFTDAVIDSVRQVTDLMINGYLARRGKSRYCDKSLGTARFAELLLRLYPRAKFICLYRHPMDVIASGLEACPWGLRGYGFEAFAAQSPGNSILALAEYWTGHVASMLTFERRFPDSCRRVRYEDLVAEPEGTAAELFSFLGASPAPGITTECFAEGRERFGPADYKIWRTSRITNDSVGRGWSIPAALIGAGGLAEINDLLAQLGYMQIDGTWGSSAPPADLRVGSAPAMVPRQDRPPVSSVGKRLQEGLAAVNADVKSKWARYASESFMAVVSGHGEHAAEYWLVDLQEGKVGQANQQLHESSDWDIVGHADDWERVIRQEMNLNVALRSSRLRYCDEVDVGPAGANARLNILASLLRIPTW